MAAAAAPKTITGTAMKTALFIVRLSRSGLRRSPNTCARNTLFSPQRRALSEPQTARGCTIHATAEGRPRHARPPQNTRRGRVLEHPDRHVSEASKALRG